MTAADDLLFRIEATPELADLLVWPGDFDIERRDPVEELRLPDDLPLVPIAGDGSGGTYFLCGEQGSVRPVLYASSEGQATLIASDLTEAVVLIAVLPYWQDVLCGHSVEEMEEQLIEDHPDYPADRARLFEMLDIRPPTVQETIARLQTAAARTVPDFLPVALHEEEESEYEPLWSPTDAGMA